MNDIYGGAKGPQRKPKINWMHRMANRIANVALPDRAYDIFGVLREQTVRSRGHDYGMANDPRKMMMPPDQYLGTKVPKLPMDEELEAAHKKNTFRTRMDTVQRDLGIRSLAPQMAGARPGIATPHGGHSEERHAFGKYATNQRAGGQFGGTIDSAPAVKDSGWSTTLAQIVGSGMLSKEQIDAASYSSVLSMINTPLGDDKRREFAFYLQRMILDGYVRGYDLVRELQQNGNSLKIEGWDRGGFNLGEAFGGNRVMFNYPRWNRLSDESKLTVFYHEIGHELLNMNHRSTGIMSYNNFGGGWTKSNYTGMVDSLFNNSGDWDSVSRAVQGQRLSAQQVDQMIKANPGMFPSLTGVDPSGIGPGGTTNTTNTINYELNPPTVNKPNFQPTVQNRVPDGDSDEGPPSKTPDQPSKEARAPLHSFAADLKEVAGRRTPSVAELAGSLQRLG